MKFRDNKLLLLLKRDYL